MKKILLPFFLFLSLLVGMPLPARAEEEAVTKTYVSAANVEGRKATDPIVDLGTGSGAVASLCEAANAEIGRSILVYVVEDQTLSWSTDEYNELSTEEKKKYMEMVLKQINASEIPPQARTKMYNFVEQRDSSVSKAVRYLTDDYSPNLYEADLIMKKHGVDDFISKVLGVLFKIILICIVVCTMMDVFYITVAPVAAVIDGVCETKVGKAGKLNKIISNDARTALKETLGERGGNTLLCYLKMRGITLFVIALIYVLILNGEFFVILGALFDYVRYAMGILFSAG